MDIKIQWGKYGGDIATALDDLKSDDGLETAVIISLFTDARHEGERGFWASSVIGEEWGSKLWTLAREKSTPDIPSRAKEYCREALKWMIEDNIASSVEIEAEYLSREMLGIKISIKRPNDKTENFAFNLLWESQFK